MNRLLSAVLALSLASWGWSCAAVLCLQESGTELVIRILVSPFEDHCHEHADAEGTECNNLERCCVVMDCTHIPLSDHTLLGLIGFDSRERLGPPLFEVLSTIPWESLAPSRKDFLTGMQARAPPDLKLRDIHLSIQSTILLI